MFTHLCNSSAAAGQVLFLTLGFTPKGVQFVKVTIFNGAPTVALDLFRANAEPSPD